MALRVALRQKTVLPTTRYRSWLKRIQDKAQTIEDMNSVTALATVCDYYGLEVDQRDLKQHNNYEVDWKQWDHILTPGILDKLKAKLESLKSEEYESEALANSAMEETEELKQIKHLVHWVATVNYEFIKEQDSIIENLSHARPLYSLNYWEFKNMMKYEDCPSRWDSELGWYMPNNDQVSEDVVGANNFQFQRDIGKVALSRYYYDWVGRHQVFGTVGKLMQTERDDS